MNKKLRVFKITSTLAMTISSCLTIFEPAFGFVSQLETLRFPASIKRTCVLYFEKKELPLFSQLQKKFKNHPEITLLASSQPSDLIRCAMTHNPDEIVIYAPFSGHKNLMFYTQASEKLAQKSHSRDLHRLMQRHALIVSDSQFSRCENKKRLQYPCNQLQRKEFQLRFSINHLNKLKPENSSYRMAYGYQLEKFPQDTFESLLSLVKTSNLNLRKIKFVNGNKRQIVNNYSSLQTMVKDQGVRVESLSPHQMLRSSSRVAEMSSAKKNEIQN